MTKVIIVFRNFGNAPTDHSANPVEANNGCLFWYPHKIHKSVAWEGRRIF